MEVIPKPEIQLLANAKKKNPNGAGIMVIIRWFSNLRRGEGGFYPPFSQW